MGCWLPPDWTEPRFRNSTLALDKALERMEIPPAAALAASSILSVAVHWDGSVLLLMILMGHLAEECSADLHHWTGFDAVCDWTVAELSHHAKAFPQRLHSSKAGEVAAEFPRVWEAAERAIQVMQSVFWNEVSRLCLHLPSPTVAASERCGALWSCWRLHERLARLTAILTTWSWVVQVGGCPNYGLFLDPYYNTAPNI